MTSQSFDQAKAEAFGGKMIDILNGAALALMASIGHRTRLFDVLAGKHGQTSQSLADSAGLQERYVREWLGAMVTGKIVDYDPGSRTFSLSPEHAAFLTRAAGTDNLATYGQFVSLLGNVEDQVVDSFQRGGGVPYSSFPKFQQVMAEISGMVHDASLVEVILPLVPGLVDQLRKGIDVADVGCGQGHAINLMAAAFPNSHFAGYDFSAEGIAAGRAEAAQKGLANASFELLDAAALDVQGRFHLVVTFDAIHDQASPARVLSNIATALKPEGVYLMVDEGGSSELHENMEFPIAPLLYTFSTMHCMTVSLAQGGDGLGAMWGEQKAIHMLKEAGFRSVTLEKVECDIENNYYIARKS